MIFGAKTLACLIGAASAILLTSTAAQAESFSGPYIGLEAGYAVTDVDGVTIAGPFERTEHSAVLAGIAGYRIPVGPDGPVVVGAEASAGSYTRRADMRYGLAGSVGLRLFRACARRQFQPARRIPPCRLERRPSPSRQYDAVQGAGDRRRGDLRLLTAGNLCEPRGLAQATGPSRSACLPRPRLHCRLSGRHRRLARRHWRSRCPWRLRCRIP